MPQNYNKSLHTYMGSDAMMFTPKVEIIRDENGSFALDNFYRDENQREKEAVMITAYIQF